MWKNWFSCTRTQLLNAQQRICRTTESPSTIQCANSHVQQPCHTDAHDIGLAGELVQQLASRMTDLDRQAAVERLYIAARIPPLQASSCPHLALEKVLSGQSGLHSFLVA